jgi:hypothetical protein
VDEIEVNLVEAQEIKAGLKRLGSGLAALVRVPELGGDKELIARDATLGNRSTHSAFVAINHRGVDVAIAHLKGVKDNLLAHLVIDFEYTDSQLGNDIPVVESERELASWSFHIPILTRPIPSHNGSGRRLRRCLLPLT